MGVIKNILINQYKKKLKYIEILLRWHAQGIGVSKKKNL
jgi:hypothetical protein